jgi:hypothetical protein
LGGVFVSLSALSLTPVGASTPSYWGPGKTTLTCIDHDGDGYGPGPGCLGPDADDDDASINTVASWKARYGTIDALLAKRGYTGILRYWFVDYTNGDDATCKAGASAQAEASPCRTYSKFRTMIKPGDAIVFRGGTTPAGTVFPMTVSGTEANPILFIGYPGEKFILDRTGGSDGIAGTRRAHLIFDGFKVYSGGSLGNSYAVLVSPHITIRNMEMEGGYTHIRMFDDVVNVTIERNVLHGNKGTENVYLGARGIPGKNVYLRHNLIYNSSGLGSGFPAVQYNGRIENYVVEGNVVYNSEQCFSWLQGVSRSVFRNNICFGNNRAMLTIYNYPGNQKEDCACANNEICPYDQTDNLIENNTLVRPRYNRAGGTVSAFAITVNNQAHCRAGDLGRNTFRNNIIVGWGNTALVNYTSKETGDTLKYIATSTFQNNVLYKPSAAISQADRAFRVNGVDLAPEAFALLAKEAAGNIVADPMFVSYDEANWSMPEANNLRLQKGSPAIGAGASFDKPLSTQDPR